MRGLRALLFGGASTDSRAADLGLLALRLVTGLSLALAHGFGKIPPAESFVERVAGMGFPAPVLFAWLAALAESAGALLLAVGLLTRPASLLVAGNMAVITLVANAGEPFAEREKGILFGAIALLFLLAGAGRYSLDALLRRQGGAGGGATRSSPP